MDLSAVDVVAEEDDDEDMPLEEEIEITAENIIQLEEYDTTYTPSELKMLRKDREACEEWTRVFLEQQYSVLKHRESTVNLVSV